MVTEGGYKWMSATFRHPTLSLSTSSGAMAFNGTWKADRSENYDKFLERIGVNVMKRKLAEHDNLKITIEQTGDNFHVKESSTFRTKEFDFTLGVKFDYSLADGTEVSGTWEMEGDMLKGLFNRKDNNKLLTTTRSIVNGELVQVSASLRVSNQSLNINGLLVITRAVASQQKGSSSNPSLHVLANWQPV
uniref:Lipocalin/cytosolic fatty-acid binding domain-containing protein n=2 Tax=Oryzias latipes TaxID=8090 RepID=A0A3B3HYW9_ORYLA